MSGFRRTSFGMSASPSAFEPLRQYLADRAAFTEDEFAFMRTLFMPKTLQPGEFLQRAGQAATHAAFVATGCLRTYVIDDKGKEHIVMFAPANWWYADVDSLGSGAPSRYFVDAIEESDVLLIDPPSHQKIVTNIPAVGALQRAGLQRHAAAKDRRIVSALSTSAEERYLEFMKIYPSIAQRVPQWMIASYLGLTPETLSRIRKNLSRK
jgi:CRP-like cAMP-binding protein